jgi:hypothetical protein
MRNLIGDKSIFAIEYKLRDNTIFLNGQFRIWIKKVFIGDFYNISPLSGSNFYLNNLLKNKTEFRTDEFLYLDNKDILSIMIPDSKLLNKRKKNINLDELIKYDKFIFSFNESFDNFIIRSYIEKENICFLWYLPIQEYPYLSKIYKGYKEQLYLEKIPLDYFENIWKEFNEKVYGL